MNNDYAWYIYNICSTWFLGIRISTCCILEMFQNFLCCTGCMLIFVAALIHVRFIHGMQTPLRYVGLLLCYMFTTNCVVQTSAIAVVDHETQRLVFCCVCVCVCVCVRVCVRACICVYVCV